MSSKPSFPTAQTCRRLILAKGVMCDVEFCPQCQLFHLNIGAMSLRLPPTALRDLCDTVGQALAAYHRAVATQSANEAEGARAPGVDGLH